MASTTQDHQSGSCRITDATMRAFCPEPGVLRSLSGRAQDAGCCKLRPNEGLGRSDEESGVGDSEEFGLFPLCNSCLVPKAEF